MSWKSGRQDEKLTLADVARPTRTVSGHLLSSVSNKSGNKYSNNK